MGNPNKWQPSDPETGAEEGSQASRVRGDLKETRPTVETRPAAEPAAEPRPEVVEKVADISQDLLPLAVTTIIDGGRIVGTVLLL